MSYYEWRPYVPVAERRRKAEKKLAKLKMKGQTIDPVRIDGRTVAKSFWGRSWCTNLERYSDFVSRLPRGRTYVRNGSVLDLQIAKGEVRAQVSGSELYSVKITMAPITGARWKAICRDCAGCIDSLVELLQGDAARVVGTHEDRIGTRVGDDGHALLRIRQRAGRGGGRGVGDETVQERHEVDRRRVPQRHDDRLAARRLIE